MNTTGAQKLKEFNITAGWLSVFCNEKIKLSISNHPSPSPTDLNIKKTIAVIWTSTMTNIRIQKLFIPPASKVWGVYRNHPVRPFVFPSVPVPCKHNSS
jgi:hypothetical protein